MRQESISWKTALDAVFLLLVFVLLAAGCARETPEFYPGTLRIEKAANLTPEERKVEAHFAKYLEEHTEEAIAAYQQKYDKEINADNARELSEDYAPGGVGASDANTRKARTKWSAAVHEPSSALSKEIYRRELTKAASRTGEKNLVVFTAGGAGAGKTTGIHKIPELSDILKEAQIVYDTTLSSAKSGMQRIAAALAAGKKVVIIYVYRDPIDAFVAGALPRAEEIGRTLPLEAFVDTHLGAPEALLEIAKNYKGDSSVEVVVVDNSRGLGKAALANLAFLQGVAQKYKRKELIDTLGKALEEAHQKGKRGEQGGISEDIYQAFRGHAS